MVSAGCKEESHLRTVLSCEQDLSPLPADREPRGDLRELRGGEREPDPASAERELTGQPKSQSDDKRPLLEREGKGRLEEGEEHATSRQARLALIVACTILSKKKISDSQKKKGAHKRETEEKISISKDISSNRRRTSSSKRRHEENKNRVGAEKKPVVPLEGKKKKKPLAAEEKRRGCGKRKTPAPRGRIKLDEDA